MRKRAGLWVIWENKHTSFLRTQIWKPSDMRNPPDHTQHSLLFHLRRHVFSRITWQRYGAKAFDETAVQTDIPLTISPSGDLSFSYPTCGENRAVMAWWSKGVIEKINQYLYLTLAFTLNFSLLSLSVPVGHRNYLIDPDPLAWTSKANPPAMYRYVLWGWYWHLIISCFHHTVCTAVDK